jgi:hypothetical protein
MNKTHVSRDQIIALCLAVVTFGVLVGLLWGEILLINKHTDENLVIHLRLPDVLVGMTVYLKTSIDFAIFIGRLMDKNRGLKGRIGIEIGTALGNAAGTFAIILLWSLFRQVNWLMAIMIIVAALVLLRLAQDGLEHINPKKTSYPRWFRDFIVGFDLALRSINRVFDPVLSKIIPSHNLKATTRATLFGLLAVSFTIPFVLGLDDFAGYVPLFNVVNIFGFAVGVFAGHMILNIFLYLSPKRTIAAVKNPLVSLFGSVAFIILAGWGLIEAVKLIFLH